MKRLLIAAATAFLAACATAAPYGPAGGPADQGWTVQPIQSNRFRVTYRGHGSPTRVRDYALLRAAELSLEHGAPWFRVENEWIDAGYPAGAQPSLGVSAGSGRFGGYRSSGVGVGVGANLSGGEATVTVIEITLGSGPRPDERDTFDAADVQRTIRARL